MPVAGFTRCSAPGFVESPTQRLPSGFTATSSSAVPGRLVRTLLTTIGADVPPAVVTAVKPTPWVGSGPRPR